MPDTEIQHNSSEENKGLCEQELRQFTGSENWYRHSLVYPFLYTDGVKYVAEKGGAYWLIDKILTCQYHIKALSKEPMCFWELTLNSKGQGARLICTDGNCKPVYSENIAFTDFPLRKIRFYFQNNVLFLPSEY